jgi:hypothetical protein
VGKDETGGNISCVPRGRRCRSLAQLAEASGDFRADGITVRTFRDPEGSNRVGLIWEIPDMAAFQEFLQSEAAAEAMKHDGVRPETILILSEG